MATKIYGYVTFGNIWNVNFNSKSNMQ